MKKTALICHSFEINGANSFILSLAAGLKNTNNFTVFSPAKGIFSDKLDDVGIKHEILAKELTDITMTLKEYDFVIINTLMMSSLVCICLNENISHIQVVHETWDLNEIDYYINKLWKIKNLNTKDILHALKKAKKIVYPANYLSDVYEEVVEPCRYKTIYCTIDFDAISNYIYKNKREVIRKVFGLDKEILFLQLGTVTERKAQLSTLKGFHNLKIEKTNIKAKLFLVGARSFRPGEKEYIEQLENYISEHDLTNDVKIFEVRKEIYPFLMACDVLIHPSVNEVLPLAILEGAAFGKAIIASDLDGIPEALKNNLEGLLINPFEQKSINKAIIKIASDEILRCYLGKNAKIRVNKQHSKETFLREYHSLIESSLNI